jgi:hypothetical protein
MKRDRGPHRLGREDKMNGPMGLAVLTFCNALAVRSNTTSRTS